MRQTTHNRRLNPSRKDSPSAPHSVHRALSRRSASAIQSAESRDRLRRDGTLTQQRGFTLIELIATCTLLGVVFTVAIPLLLLVAQERRSADQRQFAMQHAANLLERTTATGWKGLAVGDLELPAPPDDLVTLLPGLERRVEVKDLADTLRSKHVTASIRWKNRTGEYGPPIRLSAWVYSTEENQQ